ncbi:MAG: hypothetical protein KAR40_09495 [Candidatus Sabulitectum sp.]|nr:hypothetical protein [Candidatus Sabulitectum sp.]
MFRPPLSFSYIFILLSVLLSPALSLAGSPPSNTIPIIAERPEFDEVDLDVFCMLSWHYFDALQDGDQTASSFYNKYIGPANQTGIFLCISPAPIQRWGHWPWGWVARMSEEAFSSPTAYARPVWKGITVGTTTFLKDTLIAEFSAPEIRDSLEACVAIMDSLFGDEEQVWFYNTFDEGPQRQYAHMIRDSIPGYYEVDDYIPNMYTQARDPIDSLPTLEEIDPQGIFSWLKYEVEQGDSAHTVVSVFALFHTISWAGHSANYGDLNNQGKSIRAYLDMEYQDYSYPIPVVPVENRPELFLFDLYPFRQVGINWLGRHLTYQNHVSAEMDTLLLAHFELGMDSTFIPVRQVAIEQERDIPILYYPQAIGKCGGDVMWEIDPQTQDTILAYSSYGYRTPTPQEFLMNCNLGLIRGARGLIPYCMKTYFSLKSDNRTSYTAGYLDRNNMPFDAPYEDWVYTDRWRDDYNVVPPDSYPPFTDSSRLCGDFDPLWDLPDRPDTTGERSVEDYMLWKFVAYGRIWNSMRGTFAQVASIAPELTTLHWWEDYADSLDIRSTFNPMPSDLLVSEIKLFNDGDDNGYAFYMNRNCYYATNQVKIRLYDNALPSGMDCSRVLDHSRRFLIPTMKAAEYRHFTDTLDAGQGRLVQFFSGSLAADIRITKPDIIAAVQSGPYMHLTKDYQFHAGTEIYIDATFYNMGTVEVRNVNVSLTDITNNELLDSETISFPGLSSSGHECDDQTVTFTWQPDSDDIGIHILEIAADTFIGEADTADNSTRVVFQIIPRDYAKAVLDDPWDMGEATDPGSPAWHTDDIEATGGLWESTFSDSVSGMFEGILSTSISGNLFRGDISLTIPEDSTIDTDDFMNLSFAAVCMNPNGNATPTAGCVLHLWWIDSHGNTHTANLSNESEIGALWNGTDRWKVYGPLDLSEVNNLGWSGERASEFWLSFRTGKPAAPAVPQPVDIRVGWVKLTE